jgi:cytidylate kinase
MAENQEKIYRLYALTITQESVEIAMMERFSRIAPGYILIYTADKQPKGSIEINGEDVKRLTKADSDWIMICAATLLRERMEQNQTQSMENLSQMVDQLSAALAAEREKIKTGGEEITDGDRDERTQ